MCAHTTHTHSTDTHLSLHLRLQQNTLTHTVSARQTRTRKLLHNYLKNFI